jgi:hypothetical protein
MIVLLKKVKIQITYNRSESTYFNIIGEFFQPFNSRRKGKSRRNPGKTGFSTGQGHSNNKFYRLSTAI